MRKNRMWLRVFFVIAFLVPAIAHGQGLATINGTVTDPSGRVVPSTAVRVTDQNTGVLVRTVTTDAQGSYVVPLLPPSVYTLDVRHSGFKSFTRSGITLRVDQVATVNFTLQLGATVQTVTVHAAPPLVNFTTGTLSEVVERTRIVNLPLNGRNAASLTLLVAGAVNSSSQSSDQGNSKTFPTAVTASINGSRPNDTTFSLDSAPNTDSYTDVNQPFPFPDALQEFSVLTSNYSAKYGNDAGGVVNIVTKSGTNQYHGDAFEFVRNAVFNARNYFAANRDQLKRNQFGSMIGGPIHVGPSWVKNKSWFFGGLQVTTIRNISSGHHATIPTPADIQGDFSTLLNPNSPENPTGKTVVIVDPETGLPFPGNMIPTTRFDKAALAFTKYLPIGQGSPDGSLFYNIPGIHQGFLDWVGRFDYQLDSKNSFVARATWDRFTNPGQFSNKSNILSEASGSTILSENYLLAWTRIIRSNIVNRARIGYSRIASLRGPPPGVPNYNTFGVIGPYPDIIPAVPDIGVSGFFGVGDTPPALFARNNEDFGDDVNLGTRPAQHRFRNGHPAT